MSDHRPVWAEFRIEKDDDGLQRTSATEDSGTREPNRDEIRTLKLQIAELQKQIIDLNRRMLALERAMLNAARSMSITTEPVEEESE